MEQALTRWQMPLVLVFLALSTLALFWPVLHHEFVDYDDPVYVIENPPVTSGLKWSNLAWAFSSTYASNWHPVTWISHMVDAQLFGLNPGRHHLTNLLFHTANTLLLFLLLKRMTEAVWCSAMVAALFALHPLHVESVAWVAERKDVLSTFFFLLTLIAYAAYARSKSGICRSFSANAPGSATLNSAHRNPQSTLEEVRSPTVTYAWYATALALFALGLMSKPMLVTVPFVLLLLDFWPLARISPQSAFHSPAMAGATIKYRGMIGLLLEKVPFFVLSVLSCTITLRVQSGAMVNPDGLPATKRLVNALAAYGDYLTQTFWPARMAVFYPYPVEVPLGKVIVAVGVLVVLSIAAASVIRKRPYLTVGWFWFIGMLVPVIGIVQVGSQARADRYTYLPLIGLFIMVVWGISCWPGLSRLWGGAFGRQLTIGCCAGGILISLGTVTSRQVAIWRNSETLFAHAADVTEENYMAMAGLGVVELRRWHYEAAMAHLNRALKFAHGHRAEAVVKYYIGTALQMQGKGLEALPFLEQAAVGPDMEAERNGRLALSLMEARRLDEAERALDRALAVKPASVEFQLAKAVLLYNEGKRTEAGRLYAEIVQQHPGRADVHQAFADFLSLEGRNRDAVEQYSDAVKTNPDFVAALNNLAWMLATDRDPQIRDGRRAIELAERACQLTEWKLPVLIGTLAAAYAEAGRFKDAIMMGEKARDKARQQNQEGVAQRNERLLEFYRSGKPFRE